VCDHCGCRSFPPIAELTAEHEEILARAWAVAEAARAGGAPAADVAELLALLDLHVAKEETGLYPVLLAAQDLSDGQLADLEEEHRVLREALVGTTFDRRDFYALAAHIEVEEMELFSAAGLGFDEDQWDEVEDAHRAVEASGRVAGGPTRGHDHDRGAGAVGDLVGGRPEEAVGDVAVAVHPEDDEIGAFAAGGGQQPGRR